jgi:hypothetical protein
MHCNPHVRPRIFTGWAAPDAPEENVMRCLDHVFRRGAMAVALLAFGGGGALLLPQAPPACTTGADPAGAPVAVPMASIDTARPAPARLVVLARVERPLC